MQGFGSMDVLCMDKTGTLTNESILLEYYMDVLGNESGEVLDLAFLNSIYHSGVRNPIDNAIRACQTMPGREVHFAQLLAGHQKADEIPFGRYCPRCFPLRLCCVPWQGAAHGGRQGERFFRGGRDAARRHEGHRRGAEKCGAAKPDQPRR